MFASAHSRWVLHRWLSYQIIRYSPLVAQCFRQRLHEFADGRNLAVLRNELERCGADRTFR